MSESEQLIEWMAVHVGAKALDEFVARFGGCRVPKRPMRLVHRRRVRILVAIALRVSNNGGKLSSDDVAAVSRETFAAPETVWSIWVAWRKRGIPELKASNSVAKATTFENLSW